MMTVNEAGAIAARKFTETNSTHHMDINRISGVWVSQEENVAVFCFGMSRSLQDRSTTRDIVVDEKTQFDKTVEITVDLITGEALLISEKDSE